MTPEGRVKLRINAYLTRIGAYQFWPVQMGMGKRTVDCLACVNGRFLAIEVKRPGVSEPSPFQKLILQDVENAKGHALTVNDVQQLIDFVDLMETVK